MGMMANTPKVAATVANFLERSLVSKLRPAVVF